MEKNNMITYRIAGQETAAEQLAIYNKVFSEAGKPENWLRKHYGNPASAEPKLFGAFDGEKLVGINGFLEMNYAYGNVKFRVVQSCDTAVDPDYRGRGIFTKLIRSAEAEFRDQGYDAMIGFPNFNSHPGFLKMGWLEMLRSSKLFLPANVRNMIRHMKGIDLTPVSNAAAWVLWHPMRKYARKAKDVELERRDSVTLEEYERCVDPDYIRFTPDERTLQWKLHDLIGYYVARVSGREAARIIVTAYDYGDALRRANVIVVSCGEGDEEILRGALAKVLLSIRKDYDMICIWQPLKEKIAGVLKQLGFMDNIATKQGSPFIIRILTEDPQKKLILSNPSLWNPTQIETDTMINLNN